MKPSDLPDLGLLPETSACNLTYPGNLDVWQTWPHTGTPKQRVIAWFNVTLMSKKTRRHLMHLVKKDKMTLTKVPISAFTFTLKRLKQSRHHNTKKDHAHYQFMQTRDELSYCDQVSVFLVTRITKAAHDTVLYVSK